MRGALPALLITASVAAIGCSRADTGRIGAAPAPVTTTNVDLAPECEAILDFVNGATYAKLDEYLPSNVASNIVAARSVSPFATLADLSAVSQVGEARLTQIYQGALDEEYIDGQCAGIYDELGVSLDDAAAMVAMVNSVSSTQLHGYLPNAWNGATNLLNLRPFTQVSQISATSGIGPVSLRQIRNAATLAQPFEDLAAAVTGLDRDVDVLTHFDWYALANAEHHHYHHNMTCFGIDPELLPDGTTIRTELADDDEVYADVTDAIAWADRYDELSVDPTAGLANLTSILAGHAFFGCYINYADDPWSGNDMAFFIDVSSGFGVLTETRWVE